MARSQDLPARRVDEVIELVGLASAARRKAGGYSLGMRQRLGIAAAMLGDPPVLILDEPFNGMDPEGIIWIRDFLRSLAAEGRAVLVSSHLMSELQDIGRPGGRRRPRPGRSLTPASTSCWPAPRGDQVLLHTPEPAEAAVALERAGASGDGHRPRHARACPGSQPSRSSKCSARRGVAFSRSTAQRASLEDVYLQLTGGETEYRAAADAEARAMTATSTPAAPDRELQR